MKPPASAIGALALLLVAATSADGAGDLVTRLDRSAIAADETVRLELTLSRLWAGPGPDLQPLERDFEVLDATVRHDARIVDGARVVTTRWVLELSPRREGLLTVPALVVARRTSTPLRLEVLPAAGVFDAAGGRGLFLELDTTPSEPYVQAQILLTVRLFQAVRVLRGRLSEPAPRNANVERLGEDTVSLVERDGARYAVVERRYALFAREPGVVEIPPIEFDGEVDDRGAALGIRAAPGTRGRRVRLASEPRRLTVRPPPSAAPAERWLPATALELSEQWSHDPTALAAGVPVTRTLRLVARGLRGEQLPALAPLAADGLKVYPDGSTLRTATAPHGVEGTSEQRSALVALEPGRITLPAVRVAWWDVSSGQPREATLAPRTLDVAPAAGASAVDGSWGTGLSAAPDRAPGHAAVRLWQSASALLAVAWLTTLTLWWRQRRRANGGGGEPGDDRARRRARAARTGLRLACANGDPARARDALLAWGETALAAPAPRSLPELARRVARDAALEETVARALESALADLDRSLYGAARSWHGERLWRVAGKTLTRPLRPRPRAVSRGALPELYPRPPR